MFDLQSIEELVREYGLLLLAPLAVIEGPIVTVIAAYAARLGYFSLPAVCIIVILADLIGDAGYYCLGRWAIQSNGEPPKWLSFLGLNKARLATVVASFDKHGGRLLVIGKLTHSAGAVVLVASGMARMRFSHFIFYNAVAQVPKSLFFVAIGWSFGHVIGQVDHWIAYLSVGMLLLLIAGGVVWIKTQKG
ncbi:DedA family protein [Rouxiella sp. WC2420]|uniref:DedA family protein n=1 Tax=Rouxiella sp. WC2420 TaxID=3234145 RepID=A0AB39VXB7_9GAMM